MSSVADRAQEPRIVVVGAGAVGAVFGSLLARSGARVTVLARGATLEALVRDAAGDHPDVAVEARMLRGDARQVLVEASARSELVVVGAHGRGWFSGLMLGSTGADVAAHALAPVLVAR